jgi:hypothetical protein
MPSIKFTIRDIALFTCIAGLVAAYFSLRVEYLGLRKQMQAISAAAVLKIDPPFSDDIPFVDPPFEISGTIFPQTFGAGTDMHISAYVQHLDTVTVFSSKTVALENGQNKFRIVLKPDADLELESGFYKYVVTLMDGIEGISSDTLVVRHYIAK